MARPLRVGIQLPEVEREVRWPEYLAMARAAEDAGFASVWMGDHYLYRADRRPERGAWEAWTMLAALAAATERVRIGPLVACLAFHRPAQLAKMAATVDEVSGGRLVLGVGAGWNQAEFRAFGVPFDQRASRFEEAFSIVRRLLSGERVTVQGGFSAVEDAVLLPPPRRRPTLMLGSNGERMLAAALPHVDAWNTWFDGYGNTPEGFARLNATITAAAERAGRDPSTLSRSACVLVAPDGQPRSPGDRPVDGAVPALAGNAAAIAAGLLDLSEAGADEAILVATPITEASIRALGSSLELLEG